MRAWERELDILRAAIQQLGPACTSWGILLEFSLYRLGKRMDAIILAAGTVGVIEFKIGAKHYEATDWQQLEGYAHALRDFHAASQARPIVPILCAENGPTRPITMALHDQVANVVETNASNLHEALRQLPSGPHPLTWEEFEASPYRPTPTIIEAARAIYAGNTVADFGRSDASTQAISETIAFLKDTAHRASNHSERIICFVTGAPGAGKTLIGLELALAARLKDSSAALLSGNPPLVHVLTEALAEDASSRTHEPKAETRKKAQASIQNLLGYLKQHTSGAAPPEHIIVFDEAQRAWDADIGKKLLDRPNSEPEIFLSILERLDWALLVCLVGPGQEINRGEKGLALWGEAILRASTTGRPWRILAAPQALTGGPDVSGTGLFGAHPNHGIQFDSEPRLHLTNSIRSYRNEHHGKWVASLLEGQLHQARQAALAMAAPPAFLTRNLQTAKNWLRRYRRGGRTVGLLASSGGVRLVAEGIPPPPLSKELDAIGHWFLKPHTDYRSAGALESPLSEFGCQGLELDYAGICWGGDLLWTNAAWQARQMSAPKWKTVRDESRRQFRINSYRVLLTRARAGLIIYVPEGEPEDPTRVPAEFDSIAATLLQAGCQLL
ncbi:DUF2075 domain-containing protein [Corallococcus sp. H22C18031201]|nr:DUF2075 domain-containing protein [Corallococcus sp. H22C18031201]